MATTQEGSLNTTAVATSQASKVTQFNDTDERIRKATAGILELDAAGLSGAQNQSEDRSKNAAINIFGALGGNMTLGLNTNIRKTWWLRDESTGGVVSVQPTGGSSPITLPKNQWVQVRSEDGDGTPHFVSGWMDPADATAVVDGTNWSETTGRELEVRKEDAEPGSAGGFVTLQGAYEKATVNPAAGDVILTLPAGYRPTIPVAFCLVAEPSTAANADVILVEVGTNGDITILNLGVWTTAQNVPIDLSPIKFHVGG